jgi:hypothetical protein
MKRLLALLMLTMICLMPLSVSASDTRQLYTIAPINFGLSSDVNTMVAQFNHNKTVTFVADAWAGRPDNPSYGLGVLVMKLNPAYAPKVANVKMAINDQSAENMLLNFSYVDGLFQDNSTSVIPCKCLTIFFYILANHTVLRPGHIDIIPFYQPNLTANAYLSPSIFTGGTPLRLTLSENEQTMLLIGCIGICALVAIVITIIHKKK